MDVTLVESQTAHQIQDIGILFLDVDIVDTLCLELADLRLALGDIAGIVLVADGHRDYRGPSDEIGERDSVLAVGKIEHLEDGRACVVHTVLGTAALLGYPEADLLLFDAVAHVAAEPEGLLAQVCGRRERSLDRYGTVDLEEVRGELVDQKVVPYDHLAALAVGSVEGQIQQCCVQNYVAMIADVDVGLVVSELLYSAEGEIVDAGGLYHVQEHIAGDQLLKLQIVVNLTQKDLQKPLGMKGFPLVHYPVVARNYVGEVVEKLRILLKTRNGILEVLTFVRTDVSEIVFSHAFLFHPPLRL